MTLMAMATSLTATVILVGWALLLVAYGYWKWRPRADLSVPVDLEAVADRVVAKLNAAIDAQMVDDWGLDVDLRWPAKRTMTPPPEHVSNWIMLRSVVAVHNAVYGRR